MRCGCRQWHYRARWRCQRQGKQPAPILFGLALGPRRTQEVPDARDDPIDIQQGFADHAYWGGPRNNPAFEDNVERLLGTARAAGVAVIHVKHDSVTAGSPLRPEAPGNALLEIAAPMLGEPVLGKTVNSAFIGTDLEERLRAMGATQVIAFGMTTDHCVSTSVRMAANLGFETTLVADACATFPKRTASGNVIDADTVHQVHLASLDGEFAEIVSTAQLIATLPNDSE